jgi:hypothetical protein
MGYTLDPVEVCHCVDGSGGQPPHQTVHWRRLEGRETFLYSYKKSLIITPHLPLKFVKLRHTFHLMSKEAEQSD